MVSRAPGGHPMFFWLKYRRLSEQARPRPLEQWAGQRCVRCIRNSRMAIETLVLR